MIFIQRKTGWKVSFKVKTREISCSSLGWMLFTVAQMAKASVHIVGDLGSIPGSGRSPGEGKGNPLQHSCLENPMDREAWWATVHEVAESQHAWATSLTHSLGWPQLQSDCTRRGCYLHCAHPQNSILTTAVALRSQTIHVLLIPFVNWSEFWIKILKIQ